jgi:hypothetical protein
LKGVFNKNREILLTGIRHLLRRKNCYGFEAVEVRGGALDLTHPALTELSRDAVVRERLAYHRGSPFCLIRTNGDLHLDVQLLEKVRVGGLEAARELPARPNLRQDTHHVLKILAGLFQHRFEA